MDNLANARLCRAIEASPRFSSVRGFHRAIEPILKARGIRGSSHGSTQNYLSGRSVPPFGFLRAASELLDVRLEWLELGELPVSHSALAESDHVIDPDSTIHAHTAGETTIDVEAELAVEAPATAGHPRAAVRAAFHLLLSRLADSLQEPPDVDRLIWMAGVLEIQLLKPLQMFSPEDIDPADEAHIDYLLSAIATLTKAVPGRRQGHGSAEQLLGIGVEPVDPQEARDAAARDIETKYGIKVSKGRRADQVRSGGTVHIAEEAVKHPRDTERQAEPASSEEASTEKLRP